MLVKGATVNSLDVMGKHLRYPTIQTNMKSLSHWPLGDVVIISNDIRIHVIHYVQGRFL